MKTFKDMKDREWKLSITVSTVKRVSSVLELDMLDLGEQGLIAQISDDPIKMVDMFYILLEDQAKEYDISEEEFGQGFAGDTIDTAVEKFLEELVNFFPKAKRDMTSKLFAKTNKLVEVACNKMDKELDAMDEEELLKEVMKGLPGQKS